MSFELNADEGGLKDFGRLFIVIGQSVTRAILVSLETSQLTIAYPDITVSADNADFRRFDLELIRDF